MEFVKSTVLLFFLLAIGAGCAVQRDRVLLREYAGYNYCHMKVETAGDPLMPTEREVRDFYGPCDEWP